MTVRNKGLAGQQTLVWDAENRLSQVQDNNGNLVEQLLVRRRRRARQEDQRNDHDLHLLRPLRGGGNGRCNDD